MTPEERAKRVMFGDNAPFMDDDILTASHGYIISYPQLVAAIREAEKAAVKAEREACAEIASADEMRAEEMLNRANKRYAVREVFEAIGYQGDPDAECISAEAMRDTAKGIAAAIRERPL